MKKPPDLDGFFVVIIALMTLITQSFLNADDADLKDLNDIIYYRLILVLMAHILIFLLHTLFFVLCSSFVT